MNQENQIKILMVDDEVKFLKAVSERLRLKGFDVTVATNGEEALAVAEKGLFDVAVVDLKMPGTDGTQLLKVLKERHRFLEIIMLTGHATIDSAVECTRLGAHKYLEKPYDFDKLVEALTETYQARLRKKFEHNRRQMEQIQRLAMQESPLGLLQALGRLDSGEK